MTVLRSYEFRRERDASWTALERLVARAESQGIRSLGADELERLPTLYRAALSSLSVARAISLDRNVLEYLEALCGRAYLCVHGPRRGLLGALATFFRERFPRAVRAHLGAIALATLLLVGGAVAAFALVSADPDRFVTLVPFTDGRGPDASTEDLRDVLYARGRSSELATFSALLSTHNASVGILAFALGFAAALPTFLLVLTNGLMLGAFAALYGGRGLGLEFWAWVLPHGVPELSAIVLCAAGGIVVAKSLVFPGRLTRLENLAREGREAGVLVGGAVALFLVAGILEGVFRQTVHSVPVRLAVALLGATSLATYLTLAGRRPS